VSIRSNAASVVFENVSKVYGGAGGGTVRAVDNVSLRVEPGELVTLLGPSGCGKTTTLRMIAGLERATTGRILIGDHDVTGLPATERDVSMVFQSYALFPHMTVFENVAYGLESSRAPKAEVLEKARAGLDLVGLADYGDRLPSELSGGQQQRVAVARALVGEPSILLADEPTGNLDSKNGEAVMDLLKELHADGATICMVTHDPRYARYAERTLHLFDGQVVRDEDTSGQAAHELEVSGFELHHDKD